MLIYAIFAVIVLAWVYILFVREWLVRAYPKPALIKWHMLEHRLWDNSRTVLISRLYWVGGILIAIHDIVAANTGWTPVILQLANLLPTHWRSPLLGLMLILTGIAFEWLRRRTVNSVEGKR